MNHQIQINPNDIGQLIDVALKTSDNNVRAQSQIRLTQMRNQNPNQFFYSLGLILNNQHQPINVKQLAGTIGGRYLGQINQNTGKTFWDDVHTDRKNQIKNCCLNSLVDLHTDIMKSAASMLSHILAIDLPKGQFIDVIDALVQNCSNQEQNYKTASITALGYVCQQIKNYNGKISVTIREQILSGVLYCVKDNNDNIVRTSLKAIENCLSFLEDMMDQPKYRDTVFNYLYSQFQNNRFVEQTYYALYQFGKVASKYLNLYRDNILNFSQQHLQMKGNMAIRNLQFWEVIGTDYATKIRNNQTRIGSNNNQCNFLQQIYDMILPSIMKCLIIENKDQQNDQNLRQSATKALSAFCESCDKNVIDLIANSVGTLIKFQNPWKQQATVILFSTVVEYPDTQEITKLFTTGFDHLFGLLMSNSQLVVKNTLYGFIRLAQFYPLVFLNHQNIQQIMNQFFDFLNVSPEFDEILGHASEIIEYLSQGVKFLQNDICNNPQIFLKKSVQFYTEKWYEFHMNGRRQINQRFATIILNVVMKITDVNTIRDLIEYMITQYYNVVNTNTPDKLVILQHCISIIHTGILVLKNNVPFPALLQSICKLIDQQIKSYDIEKQGLALIGATCTSFGRTFDSRYKKYWPYIQKALKMTNDADTFKAALSCAGDLARGLQSSFNHEVIQFTSLLFDLMGTNIDRELKLNILTCIGDVMIGSQIIGQMFLDKFVSLCDLCFQAVYNLHNQQSQLEYVQSLKQTVIQMYSCVMFCINSTKSSNLKLYQHFGVLATFVVRSCAEDLHPTVGYVKTCLYLLFDSAAFLQNSFPYHQEIKNIIQSNQITNLIHRVAKFKNRTDISELLDFISKKRRI